MQSNTTKIKAALARLSSSSMGASVWAYSKLALGGGLVALLVVFSVQNANDMQVRFLGWETRMSQAVVVLSALMCGLVFGVAFNSWFRWRSSR